MEELLAIYTVNLRHLVSMASGLLSGLAFDWFGAYRLYAIALGGCLLTWLVLKLGTRRERTHLSEYHKHT